MIEEGLNFRCSHLPRVALTVEKDVLPDPVATTLFGAGAEMTASADG
jgi:hypothetical protein